MATGDSTRTKRLFRAGSAIALFLAGLVVLAVGGAGFLTDLFGLLGVSAPSAQVASFAIAALVPPVFLLAATRSISKAARPRNLAVGGVVIATVGALGSVLGTGLQPSTFPPGSPLTTLLTLGYALGTLLTLGALLDGLASSEAAGPPSASSRSWQVRTRAGRTRSRRSHSGAAPADGGSEDTELAFPLDADAKEDAEDRDA